LCLIIATILVVAYGKGYRPDFGSGKIDLTNTGLLVTTSLPDGASVYVNGKLKTATDNTINLAPGSYDVKIQKEGYFTWQKKVIITASVVSRADALLVPTAPKLENITISGAQNPIIDPTLTKIAFLVSSQSAVADNGIFMFDMKNTPLLTLQSASKQIVSDSFASFSASDISWSPDGKDIVATISAQNVSNTYLLDTDQPNNPPNNVSANLIPVSQNLTNLKNAKERAALGSLPSKVRRMASQNFQIMAYSPDQNKILYTASRSATLPIIIKPRLFGVNSTPEQRNIEEGKIYVYDVKEDKNYRMDSNNFKGAYSWFTDNKHFIFVRDKELHLMEYDGLNDTVVYAGPFIENYVFPWPDATKIVVLTNLGNSKIAPNLYTISLK
jgi:hypothetical protein